VSRLLGYTSLATTSRYLNVHRTAMQSAMAKLEHHRPAVAQGLHNTENQSQADVPEPASVQETEMLLLQ
jgi:hypothetical protein